MIILKITMNVMSDKKKELAQTLLSIMEALEKAAGCLSCTLYCDIEDKSFLMLLEEWRNRKDLDQHLRSEIFGVLLGTKSLLNEPHDCQIYTIQQSESEEAVLAAREKNRHEPYKIESELE